MRKHVVLGCLLLLLAGCAQAVETPSQAAPEIVPRQLSSLSQDYEYRGQEAFREAGIEPHRFSNGTIKARLVGKGASADGREMAVVRFDDGSNGVHCVLMADDGVTPVYKSLGWSSDTEIFLADVDGDGGDEIIAFNADLAAVWRVRQGALEPLFEQGSDGPALDAGLKLTYEPDFRCRMRSRYTGYERTFDLAKAGPFYEKDGTPTPYAAMEESRTNLMENPVFRLEPVDVDGDGVFELRAMSEWRISTISIDKLSMVSKVDAGTLMRETADCAGVETSTFRYRDGAWQVIDVKFEPNDSVRSWKIDNGLATPPSNVDKVHGYEAYKLTALELSDRYPENEWLLDRVSCQWMGKGVLEPGGGEATVLFYQVPVGIYPEWVVVILQDGETTAFRTLDGGWAKLWLADVDGDGCKEFVNLVDFGNGPSAGMHRAQVYWFREGEVKSSAQMEPREMLEWPLDTGFTMTMSDGFRFTVRNRFTGSETTYTEPDDEFCFSADGASAGYSGMSLLHWLGPVDYDGDGVSELNCIEEWRIPASFQYRYAGVAASILKYDGAGGWRVVKSAFFPEDRWAAAQAHFDALTDNWQRAANRLYNSWYQEGGPPFDS